MSSKYSYRGLSQRVPHRGRAQDGSDPGAAYAQTLINTYGATEVWRLSDMVDQTIIASNNTAWNGTATGFDLEAPNAVVGPVTGATKLAPYLDGANDKGDIDTAAHVAAFNGAIGSIFGWLKFPSAAWTDGQTHTLFNLYSGSTAYLRLMKHSTDDQLRLWWFVGGAFKSVTYAFSPPSPTAWTSFGVSYSDSTGYGELKLFIDGSQVSSTVAVATAWSGALDQAWIGATDGAPSNVILGNLEFYAVRYGNIWTPTDFANMHAAVS